MGRVNAQTPDVLEAVRGVRDAVADTSLPVDVAPEARAIVNQLDDYVLPRLANLDAPLLAVIGGSTGSGKSTLVNGLLRERVSNPGVIRPTTRQPVLVANPGDAEWFNSPQVLPGLTRSHGAGNEQSTTLRVVGTQRVPEGLALLDAPDFDSIDDQNRALASQLLAAADLWIFVTTPARYADQLVWNFLNDAASRGIEVVVVLNRLDEKAAQTVPDDLRRMMNEAGLGQAAAHEKDLGVLFPALTEQFVVRQRLLPRLQPFLQAGLGVLGNTAAGQCDDRPLEQRQHDPPAGLDVRIQVHRGDHRFQRIGQDGIAAVPAGFHFARPEHQAGTEIEFTRDRGQRGFAHQLRPGARERALVGGRPARVERLGDQRTEDRIAQKLEALVVRRAGAAMRQRLHQQRGIAKRVFREPPLLSIKRRRHRGSASAWRGTCPRRRGCRSAAGAPRTARRSASRCRRGGS